MNTRIYINAAAVLFSVFMPLTVFADILFLKNGKELMVQKAWLEGDQVCFIYQDIKASIPQIKVMRIKSDSGNSAKSGVSAIQSLADSDKKYLVLNKDGLGDLKWGDRVANVGGLEIKPTDSGFKEVLEYVRPQDPLKLGDAQLTSVVYAFWRNQLYTVTIWTQGQADYLALRHAVFEKFGEGIKIDRPGEGYLWSDGPSDVMLEYSEENQHGMLWMRSKELDRKFKLSRLSGHTSYIRLMKSKN